VYLHCLTADVPGELREEREESERAKLFSGQLDDIRLDRHRLALSVRLQPVVSYQNDLMHRTTNADLHSHRQHEIAVFWQEHDKCWSSVDIRHYHCCTLLVSVFVESNHRLLFPSCITMSPKSFSYFISATSNQSFF